MRAIIQEQYGGPEVLRLENVKQPRPLNNEVLVKVQAAAVNDYDWCRMTGKPYAYRLLFGVKKPKVKVLGMEFSGIVEAVGKEASKFQIGDAVYGDVSDYGFGGLAEYACVNQNALSLKPECMSFDDAAAIPHAGLLAVQGLINLGKIKEGQRILINGAGGGMGILALQLAKQYGAEVTGVDSTHKLEAMAAMGYDFTIDFEQNDFTKNGIGYDLILDAKTNRSPFAYLRALAPGGHYITVGGDLARLIQVVLLKRIIRKLNKKGMDVVALKPNQGLDYLERLYAEGKIKPLIDGPYTLDDVPRLVQYFGEGKHIGKIVVKPWSSPV